MNKQEFIINSLKESAEVKLEILDKCSSEILSAIDALVKGFKNDKKLLICGNGGSAADSQHLATEFVIRLNHDLNRPAIPALALTTDSSNLTAGANDIGYENVFARSVEAFGREGDVLIAISTSGNSQNIINAVKFAHNNKMTVIGFLGGTGGALKDVVDIPIIIPSSSTQRIQEGHITVGHILCEVVERELYEKSNS